MHTPQPDTDLATLEQHIAQAEERLVARQLRLRAHLAGLQVGARQALRPQRLLTPLLGAGLAAIVAGWVWRLLAPLHRQRRAPAPAAVDGVAGGRGGGVPWTELLLIAWPLMPARWRGRLSPATATAALALGLPLLRRLAGLDSGAPPPATVVEVDLARYAGTWFEIARLPAPFEGACAGQPSATYTPRGDGSELEVLNRCPARQGGERLARGVAHAVPGSGGARLKVSLLPVWLRWLPLAWTDYWILYLDTGYSVAMVGDPGRRFLWILAREPQIPAARLQALVALAAEEGYPVQRLHVVATDTATAG